MCKASYSKKTGHLSLPPAIYSRLLLIGYFAGIDSERVVVMKTGAVVAVTVQPANHGDTASFWETSDQRIENVMTVLNESSGADNVSDAALSKLATDTGYHSIDALKITQNIGFHT